MIRIHIQTTRENDHINQIFHFMYRRDKNQKSIQYIITDVRIFAKYEYLEYTYNMYFILSNKK